MDAVLLTAQDGSIFAANQAACDMLGMSESELVSAGRDGIVDLNDPRLLVALKERALTGKFRGELNYKRKDGTVFPVELSSAVFNDSRGNERTCIIAHDITERKKLEDDLDHEHFKLREYFENLPLLAYNIDFNGNIADCNNLVLRTLGYDSKEELIGKPLITTVYAPACQERAKKLLQRWKEEKKLNNEELQIITKQGELIDVLLNADVVFDREGTPLYSISTHLDITDRKRAQTALLDSEERFQAAFMASPNAIAISRQDDGVWLDVNQMALDMFGYTREEAIGKSALGVNLWVDLRDRQEIVEALGRSEPVKSREVRLRRKDGSFILASLSVRRLILKGEKHLLFVTEDITERKRMEEALRSLAETGLALGEDVFPFLVRRLAALQESRYALIARIDPDDLNTAHTLAVWNSGELGENFKYTLEGTPCENVAQQGPCFYPGNIQGLFPHSRMLADMKAESYWGVPLRDSMGNVIGTLSVIDDRPMTMSPRAFSLLSSFAARAAAEIERKRIEKSLRESEELFRSIVESTSDCILVWDKGYNYLYANQAAVDHVGTTRDKVIGKNIREGLGHLPDFMQLWMSRVDRAFKEGRSFRVEDNVPVGDRMVYSESVISPIKGPDGQVIAAGVVYRDMTARKKAEDDLCAAEHLFREFAENVGAVFWISTPDFGKILYINVAYEQISQRSCASIMENARSWLESVHSEDRPHVSEVMKTNPERGWTVEFRIIRPDGSVRWIRNRAFPLKGMNGTVLRMGGIAEDITEEKRLQQEAEYRRQQIIHADKLSALGEVVAGVAHEINNPNSFISYNIPLLDQTWKIIEPIVLGYARAHPQWSGSELSLDELCQDMRGIIQDIQGGSDRINRIVKNLKDFARMEESGHARPVRINDVIEKTMTIVGAQIRKHDVKITRELAEDLPEIEAHFSKLEQVIANLLVNAAHAVKGREDGRIVVSTRYVERLDAVLVSVEDNGAGITRDAMDRLFDPFFTTRRSDGGTGLGLSVSHGLIEEHNGILGVLSKPGVGSRFTIFLPVDLKERLELKPTILYVDDDPAFLGLLRTRFLRVNQCAEGLRSSEDVMTYLGEHPEVDIVFSDLMMPNVNGWELLTRVKEKYPLLTFVLYSGDSDALKARPEHAPEPDYLLEKPFTMKLLAEIVSEVNRQRL
jgi:PAS domain S-box-containing protein